VKVPLSKFEKPFLKSIYFPHHESFSFASVFDYFCFALEVVIKEEKFASNALTINIQQRSEGVEKENAIHEKLFPCCFTESDFPLNHYSGVKEKQK
jgi:hypothetical protein